MGNKAEKAKQARKSAKLARKSAMAKKALTKNKKKKWVQIFAPPFFGEQVLGECLVVEAEELMGRKLSVSMMNLTKEVRKQAISVQFEVIQTKGSGVQAAMAGYELSHSQAKRLARKNRDKIGDSFLMKSKDDKVVRIKPLLISKNRIPKSLQSKVRLQARQLLANEAAKLNYQKLIEQVVAGKIQKQLKVQLQKFYPLSACEIRQLVIDRSSSPLELGDTVMEIPKRSPRKPRPKREDSKVEPKAEETKSEPKAEKPKPEEPKVKKEESKVEPKSVKTAAKVAEA